MFCFWRMWIQCIFKCLEGGWCLLLTTFTEGWFEAVVFLNCSIGETIVTLFDLLRTLQASQASPLSWDKRMIPSKSRYLFICTDIIEMFPATSGNFLSCTSAAGAFHRCPARSCSQADLSVQQKYQTRLVLQRFEMHLLSKEFRIISVNAAA